MQSLLNAAHSQAKQLLQDNRELLDEIALYLLEKETITGDEMMAYVHAHQKKTELPETDPQADSTDFED